MSAVDKTYTLCRYIFHSAKPRVGLMLDEREGVVGDLTFRGIDRIEQLTNMKRDELLTELGYFQKHTQLTTHRLSDEGVKLLTSAGSSQSVWAAGVTYKRSAEAREDESGHKKLYTAVYENRNRSEIFPKAFNGVVGPDEPVGIRIDSTWDVPEPELVIFFNHLGEIVGYSAGNDMSSRSIEGENPLYLPQAKFYDSSCAVAPFIRVGLLEEEVRKSVISVDIYRAGASIFHGEGKVADMNRTFTELRDCLFKHKRFPNGVALLTGTNTVPPDSFTLQDRDIVKINISGIANLNNPVVKLKPAELPPIE